MSFNAYCRVEAQLLPGTSVPAVTAACQPFLDWRGDPLLPDDSELYETGIAFDESDGQFVLQVTSSCPDSFAEAIFAPVIKAIGVLATAPFEAVLSNDSTSSDDARQYRLIAGPADQVEEFRSKLATQGIREWLAEVSPPTGSSGLELAAARALDQGFEISMPDAATGAARPRISVDLAGLDLTERERDQITRLTVVLARAIGGHAPFAIHTPGNAAGPESDEQASGESPRG